MGRPRQRTDGTPSQIVDYKVRLEKTTAGII